MGFWSGIKYALNSTLGTNEFKSLDKVIEDLIYNSKGLVASDEDYYLIASSLSGTDGVREKIKTITMRNFGSIRISVSLRYSDTLVYIYKNGTQLYSIKGTSVSFNSFVQDVAYNKNDVISIYYKTSGTGDTVQDLKICASIKDLSPIIVEEV